MNRNLHKIICFVAVKGENECWYILKNKKKYYFREKINFKRWKNMTRVVEVVEDFVGFLLLFPQKVVLIYENNL
jgi:hypothetical protein